MENVMRDALVQIYLHCVWGTWNRLPLITQDKEKQVYEAILEKCKKLDCIVIAIGGMPDHVHLLVRFPSTISIADFAKEVKGSTSHLITQHINIGEFFKWQGSYAAFSVSKQDIPMIKSYIQHQKEHHDNSQVEATLEL
jgi:REP element-mobilizing transposase RayT